MKKLLAIALLFVVVGGLAGCDSSKSTPAKGTTQATTVK
jgi:hypothetical protein